MYYNCIVPECRNSSTKYPNKIFIQVPNREPRRSQWIEVAGRESSDFSAKTTTIFVCEDHFDLEHDMENYMRWKMFGGVKIMKKDAIPHKFSNPRIKRVAKASKSKKIVPKKHLLLELHAPSNSKSRPQSPSVSALPENVPTKRPLLEFHALSNSKSGPQSPSSTALPENVPKECPLLELHALSNTKSGPQSLSRPARRNVGINVRPRPKDQQTQTDDDVETTYLLTSEQFEKCQATTFSKTVFINNPSFTLELQNLDDDNDVDEQEGTVCLWLVGS